MKKKWLISVDDENWNAVIEELKERKVQILEILELIHVIIVSPDSEKKTELKKIKGVIDIEEERESSI